MSTPVACPVALALLLGASVPSARADEPGRADPPAIHRPEAARALRASSPHRPALPPPRAKTLPATSATPLTGPVSIGALSDRTGRAGVGLPSLREALASELSTLPAPPRTSQAKRYTIDASITKLEQRETGPYTELGCEVSFIVSSLPGRAMLAMTSVHAVAQVERSQFSAMRDELLRQVVDGAVHGGHKNLVEAFGRVRAARR